MIQFLIFMTTMCPQNISSPCWEKAEVIQKSDWFEIVSSTFGAECEIKGHDWIWQYDSYTFRGNMQCLRCGVVRRIKKVEHKIEKIEYEELWEDDGTKVERLPSKGLIFDGGIVPMGHFKLN